MAILVAQIVGPILTFLGAFLAAWPGLTSERAAAHRALDDPIHAALVAHDALLGQRKYAIAGIAIAGIGLTMTLAGTLA